MTAQHTGSWGVAAILLITKSTVSRTLDLLLTTARWSLFLHHMSSILILFSEERNVDLGWGDRERCFAIGKGSG